MLAMVYTASIVVIKYLTEAPLILIDFKVLKSCVVLVHTVPSVRIDDAQSELPLNSDKIFHTCIPVFTCIPVLSIIVIINYLSLGNQYFPQ